MNLPEKITYDTKIYNEKCDIFSLGIILLRIIKGFSED